MSTFSHVGEVLSVLLVLLVALSLATGALVLWVNAIADLLWMALLRRRLTLGVVVAVAFGVLLVAYSVLPQKGFPPFALPLLLVVAITPITAVRAINRVARRLYNPARSKFAVPPAVLAFADVFALEDMRLRSEYRAPESELSPTP